MTQLNLSCETIKLALIDERMKAAKVLDTRKQWIDTQYRSRNMTEAKMRRIQKEQRELEVLKGFLLTNDLFLKSLFTYIESLQNSKQSASDHLKIKALKELVSDLTQQK